MNTPHRCPVCRQPVQPTIGHHIAGHLDTTGRNTCPGSFEPYHITMTSTHKADPR